jgi:uncharacterized protein YbjT (DUF2867 family)
VDFVGEDSHIMRSVLVTGATGNVGSGLVPALAGHDDVKVRAATRLPDLIRDRFGPTVTGVFLDWEDPGSMRAAVDGVDAVYVLTPVTERHHEAAIEMIDAAETAGVQHIVRQSTVGADLDPVFLSGRWHRLAEARVAASSAAHTILRPNLFMDDFMSYFRPGADGAIRLPLAASTTSYIDARDIADVALRVLTEGEPHFGQTYTITGAEALSAASVAGLLSRASGAAIHYVDTPADDYRAGLEAAGLPQWLTASLDEMYQMMREGSTDAVTDTVLAITGQPPRSFATFAADRAAAWAPVA